MRRLRSLLILWLVLSLPMQVGAACLCPASAASPASKAMPAASDDEHCAQHEKSTRASGHQLPGSCCAATCANAGGFVATALAGLIPLQRQGLRGAPRDDAPSAGYLSPPLRPPPAAAI